MGTVWRFALGAIAFVWLVGAVSAQETLGPVTNLPLPRYVSLKADEANVRRGPTLTHRIDWVFTRRGMPLKVVAEHGHWRKVQDRDGAGGWVHYALLSGARSVIIAGETVEIQTRPEPDAPVEAIFEGGVVARLESCTIDWCRVRAGGHRGWAPKDMLWGVLPDELRE